VRSAVQRHQSPERPILRQISSLIYSKIQQRQVIMNVLHPGRARPPRWSRPVLWRRFEDGLAIICGLVGPKKTTVGWWPEYAVQQGILSVMRLRSRQSQSYSLMAAAMRPLAAFTVSTCLLSVNCTSSLRLQCCDTVGWASGRASGL